MQQFTHSSQFRSSEKVFMDFLLLCKRYFSLLSLCSQGEYMPVFSPSPSGIGNMGCYYFKKKLGLLAFTLGGSSTYTLYYIMGSRDDL